MSSSLTLARLLDALALESAGPHRYRGANLDLGGAVVFGGQLLAQTVVAALDGTDGQSVKTIHTVFARGADPAAEVELDVDRMHRGRTFASSTVTVRQGERICARSSVLLTSDDADLIRHADSAPAVGSPEEATPESDDSAAWQVRVVDGVDVADPDAVGPAELGIWTRFPGAPEDPGINQALLALATDGFLIGTAMRPHPGVGQSQAHVSIATSVISHTLTFHEPVRVGEWLLLAHRSPYAGRGRSYGAAEVFRRDGQLVASFVQDAMIRAMPSG